MRVLAIDTALEACSVAVLDTERRHRARARSLPMQRGHAEALMPLIARVHGRAPHLDFAALDRIAVTTGPGSFTGLRVGIAAARGIALAAGKPAIGLSTLAAFAAPFIAADDTLPVAVAIDARHDHVYLQVFGPGGRTLVAPRIAPLREALRAADGRRAAHHRHRGQHARGALARGRTRADRRRAARARPTSTGSRGSAPPPTDTPPPPKPLYLRAPDAQPQDAAQLAAPMIGFVTQSVRARRAGAVGGRHARRRRDRGAARAPRSGAAGASRRSKACCSTATSSPIAR